MPNAAPSEKQQELVEAIARLLDATPGVDAAWLAGSLGKDEGDVFSDVDVLALVADGAAAEVLASIDGKLSQVATPVLVNRLPGGRTLNIVTEDWLRFDISLAEAANLSMYDAAELKPLFNKTGRGPTVRPPMLHRISPEQLTKLVQEFLRVLGLSVVVLGREDYVMSLSGFELQRQMTLELMLEENGIGPGKRGGMLRRNPMLTAEQRAALVALPPLAANRTSVLAGLPAIAAIFLPRARRLAAEIGMTWPTALEEATRRHLSRNLGVQI